MNADLPERFRQNPQYQRKVQADNGQPPSHLLLPFGNRLQEYLSRTGTLDIEQDTWISSPEFPLVEELIQGNSDTGDKFNGFNDEVVNIIDRPWESTVEYLKAHYLLLREDALRPLRQAVTTVLNDREANEPSPGSIGIYDDVHITGMTFCNRGLGVRLSFSLRRVGKQIKWNQSKRLVIGSLVVLLPAQGSISDCASSIIVAIVAARPLSRLQKEPPEIDLFFARPCDFEIDVQTKWIMVEQRNGFFEAQRYTMLALQKMMSESFPLSEHLVALKDDVECPKYVKIDRAQGLELDEMDESQQAALNRIRTKRLALVQGPPGTGKTYVSTRAIDIMLRNMSDGDSPIIISCQTNHALDQILRKVAMIWPKCFVRLGSRSMDREVVQERTLFNVRENMAVPRSSRRGLARRKIRDLTKIMKALLSPFQKGSGPLNLEYLQQIGVLSEAQCHSLRISASKWQNAKDSEVQTELQKWAGTELKRFVPHITQCIFPEVEEAELDLEELNEEEAENAAKADEEEIDFLQGVFITLGDDWAGQRAGKNPVNIGQMISETEDMSKVKPNLRGAVYNFLVQRAKEIAVAKLRELMVEYSKAVEEHKIGKWEEDAYILSKSKIIGVTTTGFSKYRPLIAAVQAKVVLIEEAAETLEAPVAVTCINSLEHLILVGDHKQLRPQCCAKELEGEPFNLNISLFERLVNNDVEFSLLKRQRRMIAGIRGLLKPLYGNAIEDHPLVNSKAERPPIPGMGKISTWFCHHTEPEAKDDLFSFYNEGEAIMIVEFIRYLLRNGMSAKEITVMTFYNGQKRKLQLFVRRYLGSRAQPVQIVTVDSYQGEENGVILLSLVRNNTRGNIGFLAVENRVCVALSRAQRGFYIFGNGELLCGESRIWCDVIKIMYGLENERRRIGFTLPLRCTKHERKTWIENWQDWENNEGGCDIMCNELMPCGHACLKLCHPSEQHDCNQTCDRRLPCAHLCIERCIDPCRCRECEGSNGYSRNCGFRYVQSDQESLRPCNQIQPTGHWNDFAKTGYKEHDEQLRLLAEGNAATLELDVLDEHNYDNLFSEFPSNKFGLEEPEVKVQVLGVGALRYKATSYTRKFDHVLNRPDALNTSSLLD